MDEPVQLERAPELVVDPPQHVAVERGGHLQGIVIREQQVACRFGEVGPEQQGITGSQRVADRAATARARRTSRSCRCSIRGTA